MELLPVIGYLDPGTGSMILQLIIGFLVGIAYAIKSYWYRILAFLGLGEPLEEEVKEQDGS